MVWTKKYGTCFWTTWLESVVQQLSRGPLCLLAPPAPMSIPKWLVNPEDGPNFCLDGYGDGRRTQFDATRRCGWSVVAARLGDDGIIERRTETYGQLLLGYQHVHTAELYFLMFYLQHAVAHEAVSKFHSDGSYVVDRFALGQAANTHGWAVDADLRSKVFDAVDDVGGVASL